MEACGSRPRESISGKEAGGLGAKHKPEGKKKLAELHNQKKHSVNKLAEDVEEFEMEISSVLQQNGRLNFENSHLEGLLEVRDVSAAKKEEEKREVEEAVSALRYEIAAVLDKIELEKKIRNSDLSEYERRVGMMCDLFFNRRKSYEEVEVEFAVEKMEKLRIDFDNVGNKVDQDLEGQVVRLEDCRNFFSQRQSTLLNTSKKLMDATIKEMTCKYLENQRLCGKIENFERYARDRAAL